MLPGSALPTTNSSMSTSRRFKPRARSLSNMPAFGLGPSIKRMSGSFPRRPFLFILLFVMILFLFSPSLPSTQGLKADTVVDHFAHAARHFREGLTKEQLKRYYEEVAADIDSRSPLNQADSRDFVITDSIRDPFFRKCMISKDHSSLHQSLKRGPDQQEILDRKNAKQPRDFDEVFATVDRKRYLFHPDRTAVKTVDNLAAGLDQDLDDAIAVASNVVAKDAGGKIGLVDVPIAYVRTSRRDGLQIIVNIGGGVNMTEGENKGKVMNMRRLVTVSKGYGVPCEVSFVRPREMVKIHVLLAYSQRKNRLKAFLKMFDNYFTSMKTDMVRLVISTTEEEKSEVQKAASEFKQLNKERLGIVTSKGDSLGNFSRAVAMREAAKTVPSDEVMFLSDADLLIGGNFLQNCRVNLIKGSQVWFPVMFSLYPYGHSLSSRDGLWRRSSYGMACMYRADFDTVGGFGGKEETQFNGWGSEDVFLYNRFRDDSKYSVLRTLEPGLQHQWHGKDCQRNQHYDDCMRTVYMTIGSQDVIAKLMSEKRVDISSLTKEAKPV